MSCITQLLKLKGDQKALLPKGKDGTPWVAVEGGGVYKNYEFLIVLNTIGHRCGYVAIPPSHPFNNTPLEKYEFAGKTREHYNYDQLDIDCHGGLTYMDREHSLKDLLPIPCNDFWIGFDCGHCFDASDTDAMKVYFGDDADAPFKSSVWREGVVRSYEYVEVVCKHIIDQLIEKEAA